MENPDLAFSNKAAYFFTDHDSSILVVGSDALLRAPSDLSTVDRIFTLPVDFGDFFLTSLAISPDGMFLVFSISMAGTVDLYLLELNSLQLTNITNTPNTIELHPSFSADSRKIVFGSVAYRSSLNPGFTTIGVYNLNTSTIDTILTDTNINGTIPPRLNYPHFNEAGDRIIYVGRNPFGASSDSLLTTNLAGENKILLDPGCQYSSGIAVSMTNIRIVYLKGGNGEILASIKIDGTGYHEITANFGNHPDYGFSISKSAEKISFWTNYPQGLFILNGDGTGLRIIARGRNARYSDNLSLIAFTSIDEK